VACETTYVFLRFFKIQKKRDFLRFFEWLTTFSRTLLMMMTMIVMDVHRSGRWSWTRWDR